MRWRASPPIRFRSCLMVALASALAVASYWPALRGGLLWDDDSHITRTELQSWTGLWRIWTDLRATQQYYPVLHSAFWVEHRLWGDATLPYHLLNVALHVAASLLLVLALRRLWEPGRTRGAGVPQGAEWLAGLLFAVHPVGVESVAWISEQKNTLSLVFYLLAGLAYLNFDRTRKAWAYAVALGFFALALGTKTVTATLPAALLVVLWWQNGRLSWRRDIVPLVPWLILGAGVGLVTAWIERNLLGATGPEFNLAMGERVLLAARVIWFYLGKLAWPANLTFIYPHWDVAASAPHWIGALLGVLGVTVGLWWVRGRSRGLLAGWLFFVGSLFPALGFVNVYPFCFSYVADHFQYLPSMGIIALATAGLALVLERASPPVKAAGPICCVILALPLSILSHQQARNYRDVITLYRATLARNPSCWMAQNNLGVQLAKTPAGEAEAIAHFRAALPLNPTDAEIYYNLANLLTKVPGELPEALERYEQALRLKPDYAEAHDNLALALEKIPGRLPEALAHFEASVRINPGNARAQNNLGFLLASYPKRAPEAIAHYEAALKLQPNFAIAHLNLANLLAILPGREAEAWAHFEQALKINPDYPEAHYGLANLLMAQPGREGQALAHYQAALRIWPDYAEAHNNLGILYAREGRLEEARQQWTRALELAPNLTTARKNLELLQQRNGMN